MLPSMLPTVAVPTPGWAVPVPGGVDGERASSLPGRTAARHWTGDGERTIGLGARTLPIGALLLSQFGQCVVDELYGSPLQSVPHWKYLRKLTLVLAGTAWQDFAHEQPKAPVLPLLEHLAISSWRDKFNVVRGALAFFVASAPALRILEAPLYEETVPLLPAEVDVHWNWVATAALDALRKWPGKRVRFTHPGCVADLCPVPHPANVGFHTVEITGSSVRWLNKLSFFSRACVQHIRVNLHNLADWPALHGALHGLVRLLPAVSAVTVNCPCENNAADEIAALCNAIGPGLRVVKCQSKYHHLQHTVAQRCPWAVFLGDP